MSFVDVEKLLGERVFVEVENQFGRAYVGTLDSIADRTIKLKDWIRVDEWDMKDILKFCDGKDHGNNHRKAWDSVLSLMTIGMLREVKTIEKNLKRGDPYVVAD